MKCRVKCWDMCSQGARLRTKWGKPLQLKSADIIMTHLHSFRFRPFSDYTSFLTTIDSSVCYHLELYHVLLSDSGTSLKGWLWYNMQTVCCSRPRIITTTLSDNSPATLIKDWDSAVMFSWMDDRISLFYFVSHSLCLTNQQLLRSWSIYWIILHQGLPKISIWGKLRLWLSRFMCIYFQSPVCSNQQVQSFSFH